MSAFRYTAIAPEVGPDASRAEFDKCSVSLRFSHRAVGLEDAAEKSDTNAGMDADLATCWLTEVEAKL